MEADRLNPFEYLEPTNIDEVLSMLDRWKNDAKVIAGGTDLIPLMRDRLAAPKCLIDINRLSELDFIKEKENTIHIGALSRLATIENSNLVQEKAPVLADAASQVGSIQIRNVGTIGGSLVNASPAADVAPPLLVREAKVKARTLQGEREIPLSEFFAGVKKTVLRNNELLTEIIVPEKPSHTGESFLKIGKRNALIISIASAATSMTLSNGKCEKVRIALGSVAPTPIRAQKTETFLEGKEVNERTITEASKLVAGDISPITDFRASAEYRREVSNVLVKRVLRKAAEISEK